MKNDLSLRTQCLCGEFFFKRSAGFLARVIILADRNVRAPVLCREQVDDRFYVGYRFDPVHCVDHCVGLFL